MRDTTSVFAKHSADLDATIDNLEPHPPGLSSDLGQLKTTLGDADTAIVKIGKLSTDADNAVSGDTASQLSELVAQSRALVTSLKRLSNELDRQPTKLIFGDRREGYTPK